MCRRILKRFDDFAFEALGWLVIPSLKPVTVEDIEAAASRTRGAVVRTPLVRLSLDDAASEVYLKLENLQPTGSFKVRGVSNVVAQLGPEAKRCGVYSVSAGNMAQALAWQSQRNGIPCTVIVPDNAALTKLEAIKRYGAKTIQLPFDDVWRVVTDHHYAPLKESIFVHPFSDGGMIAGNGTIGLEILEDLPGVEEVLVPFGGGGLSIGIATAIAARRPRVGVYGVEPETASPLAASFSAGSAQEVDRVPSFVDGIGAKSVLPEVWEVVKSLLKGSLVVSLAQVASAVRLLVERSRVVAEGAGAASVAAALARKGGHGKTVAVVSGGNIDSSKLAVILQGGVP